MKEKQVIADIEYISAEQAASLFPERPAECHKGDFGYVALIGGSLEYSGAVRLAARANAAVRCAASDGDKEADAGRQSAAGIAAQGNAAMRSGAGVAAVAAPRSICPLIAPQILEATLYPLSDDNGELVFSEEEFSRLCRRYDCIAFGMGIGNSDETLKAVRYMLGAYDKKLILDADGLNALARISHEEIRSSKASLILTPHLGEFSRLSGMTVSEIKADPSGAAVSLADELDAVVLLKGSTTIVASPSAYGAGNNTKGQSESADRGRRVYATDRGCPGMATAGSGDVLSGIIAALCVNAEDLALAAVAGAYINGAAGELAQSRRSDVTMTSADTAACVAEVIEEILDR